MNPFKTNCQYCHCEIYRFDNRKNIKFTCASCRKKRTTKAIKKKKWQARLKNKCAHCGKKGVTYVFCSRECGELEMRAIYYQGRKYTPDNPDYLWIKGKQSRGRTLKQETPSSPLEASNAK